MILFVINQTFKLKILHMTTIYTFIFFLIATIFGLIALDRGILLMSILITFPYVIFSQLIMTFFHEKNFKYKSFVIAFLISVMCLTSHMVLKELINGFGFS